MSLLTQVARSAGLDRNPMRRRCDLVEAWTRVFAAALLVSMAPTLAWIIGSEAYQHGVRIENAERALRHRTEAVLLQEAKDRSTSPGVTPTVLATAAWTMPDGTTRTGWVPAKVNTTSGATVPLWIDRNGLPTTPPRPHDETVAQTVATTVLVPVVVAMLVFACQLVIRTMLDRRRLRQWQAGWQEFEPLWSGRKP